MLLHWPYNRCVFGGVFRTQAKRMWATINYLHPIASKIAKERLASYTNSTPKQVGACRFINDTVRNVGLVGCSSNCLLLVEPGCDIC